MPRTTIKQNIVATSLSVFPFSLVRKFIGERPIIPYYHMISDDEKIHVKHLYGFKNIRQFKSDIDFLLKYFVPISLLDLISSLKTGASLKKNAFLLTFDDGFSEMHDIVAPILKEKGVPATFFASSAFIDNKELCYLNKLSIIVERLQNQKAVSPSSEIKKFLADAGVQYGELYSGILSISYRQKDLADRIAELLDLNFIEYLAEHKPYLTSEQIAGLIRDGFTIGAHSIDHPLYALLSLEDQLHQTKESVCFIKKRFGLSYGAFAFPHSDNKVSNKFFTEIYGSGLLDISFGTGGLINDECSQNFQRFSLEKPLFSADKIIALQWGRKIFNSLKGNHLIVRQ